MSNIKDYLKDKWDIFKFSLSPYPSKDMAQFTERFEKIIDIGQRRNINNLIDRTWYDSSWIAKKLYEEKRYDEAEILLDFILERKEEEEEEGKIIINSNKRIYSKMLISYISSEDYDKAEEVFKKPFALSILKCVPIVASEIESASSKEKFAEKCEKLYRNNPPSNKEIQNILAKVALNNHLKNKNISACKELLSVIGQRNENCPCYLNMYLGDLSKEEQHDLEECIFQSFPGDPIIQDVYSHVLIETYLEQGDVEKFKKHCDIFRSYNTDYSLDISMAFSKFLRSKDRSKEPSEDTDDLLSFYLDFCANNTKAQDDAISETKNSLWLYLKNDCIEQAKNLCKDAISKDAYKPRSDEILETLFSEAQSRKRNKDYTEAKNLYKFVAEHGAENSEQTVESERIYQQLDKAYIIGTKYQQPKPEQEFFQNVIDICQKSNMMSHVIDKLSLHNVPIIYDNQIGSYYGQYNPILNTITIANLSDKVTYDDVDTLMEEMLHAYDDLEKKAKKAEVKTYYPNPIALAQIKNNLEASAKARKIAAMQEIGGSFWDEYKKDEWIGPFARKYDENLNSGMDLSSSLAETYKKMRQSDTFLKGYVVSSIKISFELQRLDQEHGVPLPEDMFLPYTRGPKHEDMLIYGYIPGTEINFLENIDDLTNLQLDNIGDIEARALFYGYGKLGYTIGEGMDFVNKLIAGEVIQAIYNTSKHNVSQEHYPPLTGTPNISRKTPPTGSFS